MKKILVVGFVALITAAGCGSATSCGKARPVADKHQKLFETKQTVDAYYGGKKTPQRADEALEEIERVVCE